MRSNPLRKSLLVAALGGAVVLSCVGVGSAAAATAGDAETRFVELATSIRDYCTPVRPSGGVIDGPAATSSVSTSGNLDSTQPVSVDAVPLTAVERCAGEQHQRRIHDGFWQAGANRSYEALHAKLTELGYPASRIHRMPDFSGSPRARVDLRVSDGDRLAVQVTGTYLGAMIETFGAPKGVNVNKVRLKPVIDRPSF
ncbi:hypothetical protein CTU88_37485 [Streptomyces sp. JV178]|uniref:hypothetical protein n=1 Tax=Streptomyces sp. JV178 TaxID=858632 RepID=UPI000C1B2FC0|nr:hypothetical protein [Streptomyces sp. JV178]PIM67650.1 hypothetical protein CTU88_37485 [Streptomyces sp. JV178]